jgi:type II secretory pathway pseudopilin PulG
VSIGIVIFGILIAAVMAGLILPATRRRRRTREALGMERLS